MGNLRSVYLQGTQAKCKLIESLPESIAMATSIYISTHLRSTFVSNPANRQQSVARLSILIADDTPAYQKFIRKILQDRGHVVTHVGDGLQATDSYRQHRFDAIVVDLQMPVMNGFELASWIREQEKDSDRHTPIIALTAHSESAVQAPGRAAGIDAYLTKPIDAQRLVQTVEELASPTKGQAMKSTTGKGSVFTNEKNKIQSVESGSIVDFDGAMVRLGGDRELFQEFIGVYDEDMPSLMEALNRAFNSRDGSGVERNAHSLRGLISNFGARRAVEAASQLENDAKCGRWQDVPDTLSKLQHEVELLTEALDAYRS